MTASHHSHSGQFCKHAQGTLRQMVESALEKGFTTYGLSEHCPRFNSIDLYPEEQGLSVDDLSSQFEAFLHEAVKLRDEYAGRIDLLIGMESECIRSEELQSLKKIKQDHPEIDYIVGSVHHWREGPIDFTKEALYEKFHAESATISGKEGVSEISGIPLSILETFWMEYLDHQLAVIQELKPEVIGHIDLCRIYFPGERLDQFPGVWSRLKRNIEEANAIGALFEVSSAAFRKGWSTAYPGTEVLHLIQSLGGRFVLSDDAHYPEGVGLHYDRLYEYLHENKITDLWRLARVDGVVSPQKMKLP